MGFIRSIVWGISSSLALSLSLAANTPPAHVQPERCHHTHWKDTEQHLSEAKQAVAHKDGAALQRALESYEDELVNTLEALELAQEQGAQVRKSLQGVSNKLSKHADLFRSLQTRAPAASQATLQTAAALAQWGQRAAWAQLQDFTYQQARSSGGLGRARSEKSPSSLEGPTIGVPRKG